MTSSPLLDKDKILKSVFRISNLLTAPSDIDKILVIILDVVVKTMGFDQGVVLFLDDTKFFLEKKVVKNYTHKTNEKPFPSSLNLYKNDCIFTNVVKTGYAVIIDDMETDLRVTQTDRILTQLSDGGSIFCAPLKIENDVLGIMGAWNTKGMKFSAEENEFFLSFANLMGSTVHYMRMVETNAEKIRQLMLLQAAVSEMNFNYALDNRILDILIKNALSIAGADKALVYFWDIEKDRCLISEGKKLFIDNKKACDEKISYGIINQAIDKNINVIRKILPNTPVDFTPIFKGYHSEIAIPLNIKDKFKGALYLAKKSGSYSQDQINILDILVKNAASAYDSAIMHSILSLEANSLKTEVEKLKEREDILLGFHNILGKSQKMIGIFHVISEVSAHNTNILVQGESGTGKELVARAIHKQSNRSSKHFVDVNCATIPGTLLESELFGYEAGAFTDAKRKKIGLLEYANGGTLLLDEIGDMGIHLQAKFLRMLEDGYIRRLGGNENIPIDVRFVFSTNKDLSKMVAEGLFREDLYYRISVVPIIIPPLRERADDIILLAKYYVEEFNKKFSKKIKGFSEEAEQLLQIYPWPGNVRELRNIIERIMILHRDSKITTDHLPVEIKNMDKQEVFFDTQINTSIPQLASEGMDYSIMTEKILNDIKSKIITNALEVSGGNKSKAAKLLRISRYKLIREQKKLLTYIH